MSFIYRSRRLTIYLLVCDVIILAALWFLSYFLRRYLNPYFPEPINEIRPYIHSLWYLLPLWIVIFAYYKHYDHRERISSLTEFSRIVKAALIILVGSYAIAYLFREYSLGRTVISFNALFSFIYLYLSRSLLRRLKLRAMKRGKGLFKTIVIGAGKTGREVAQRLMQYPEVGYHVVGFLDDDSEKHGRMISGLPVLGSIPQLREIIPQHGIEVAFFAIPNLPQSRTLNTIVDCEDFDVIFHLVSHAFEVITDQSRLDVMAEIPVHRLPGGSLPGRSAFIKRVVDLTVAVPVFLVSLFWAVPVGLAIGITSKKPVIFRQERIGYRGKPFTLYKFRTMYADADPYQTAPTDPADPRITAIGRVLRKYSLDEFPQLWNVILGDMSLVGPRPEMPFIVDTYEKWQRYRLSVKPGITGLWQIMGRKNLPLELNLEYDLYYIKNQSLFLDLMILLKTIPAVFWSKGAY